VVYTSAPSISANGAGPDQLLMTAAMSRCSSTRHPSSKPPAKVPDFQAASRKSGPSFSTCFAKTIQGTPKRWTAVGQACEGRSERNHHRRASPV